MSGSIAWDASVPNFRKKEIGVYELVDSVTGDCLIVGGTVDGTGFRGRLDNYKKMLSGRHKRRANADLQALYDGGARIDFRIIESRLAGDRAEDARWRSEREAHWIAVRRPRLNKLGAEAGAAMCEPAARARNSEIEKSRAVARRRGKKAAPTEPGDDPVLAQTVALLSRLLAVYLAERRRRPLRPWEKLAGEQGDRKRLIVVRLSDIPTRSRRSWQLEDIEDNPLLVCAGLAIREVGFDLAERGGLDLMRRAWELAPGDDQGASALDRKWDGIGGWWS